MGNFVSCLYVMVGGAVGTLVRYLFGIAFMPFCRTFPWSTLSVNIISSFLISFFSILTLANGRFPVSENFRIFFMTGLCGGLSTVSSFSLQTLTLWREGSPEKALLNICLTLFLTLGAVTLGFYLGSALNSHFHASRS